MRSPNSGGGMYIGKKDRIQLDHIVIGHENTTSVSSVMLVILSSLSPLLPQTKDLLPSIARIYQWAKTAGLAGNAAS
jgi:hypothetical protein